MAFQEEPFVFNKDEQTLFAVGANSCLPNSRFCCVQGVLITLGWQ